MDKIKEFVEKSCAAGVLNEECLLEILSLYRIENIDEGVTSSRFLNALIKCIKEGEIDIKRFHEFRLFPEDVASLYFWAHKSSFYAKEDLLDAFRKLVEFCIIADGALDKSNARGVNALTEASNCISRLILDKILDSQNISGDGWGLFGDICLLNNNINAYYHARSKSIDFVMSSNSGLNKKSIKKISALKECGYNIENFNSGGDMPAVFDLINCNINNFLINNKSVQDSLFLNYIKDKSVAIVGPVNVGLNNGPEIDGFDVIVRLNYRESQENLLSLVYGSKCHVSYYASDIIKQIKSNLDIKHGIDSLDWAMFTIDADVENLNDVNVRRNFNTYRFNPCFKGALNAVPKAILDILLHEPKVVKVFNANLWMNQQNVKDYHFEKKNEVNRFIWHDPASNFLFMQNLFENNLFLADNVLQGILRMSVAEYIEALSAHYHSRIL